MRNALSSLVVFLSTAGLTVSASAQVTLDQWGAYATIATSVCADDCDPATDISWLPGLTFGPTNGESTLTVVDATSSGLRGDAFAETDVGTALGPIVRVNADSLPGGWVDGTGTAVQGYTYTGLVVDTIAVNVALTGTIGNPDLDPSTGLAAQVSYVGDANVASLVFETAVTGLLTPDGAVQLETTADGPVNLNDVLMIPVNPGDQFYLIASSAASAGGIDAFATSLSTLAITFDTADAENLEAAGVAGPVPALPVTLAIVLALVLIAVVWRARAARTLA